MDSLFRSDMAALSRRASVACSSRHRAIKRAAAVRAIT